MSKFIEEFFDVEISLNRVIDKVFFFMFLYLVAKGLMIMPGMSEGEILAFGFLSLFALWTVIKRVIMKSAGYLLITDIIILSVFFAGSRFFMIAVGTCAALFTCACYCLSVYLTRSGRIKPGKGVGDGR